MASPVDTRVSRKRKIEAVCEHIVSTAGEHIVSAAVGDLVSRTISAAVGKLEEHAGVESQLERLDMLVMMVRSAVAAAEGVHIRNWWLRRWLWRLREAACEGEAVVRSFRRRAAEEAGRDNAGTGPWWARLLRKAKSHFFRDGGSTVLIRCAVARLEEVASGLGDFPKLLDMELTRVPLQPPRQPPPAADPTEDEYISDWEERTVYTDPGSVIYVAGGSGGGDHCCLVEHEHCWPESSTASWSNEPEKAMEGRIIGVIRFAVGASVIWFAFQVGSKIFSDGELLCPRFHLADCKENIASTDTAALISSATLSCLSKKEKK